MKKLLGNFLNLIIAQNFVAVDSNPSSGGGNPINETTTNINLNNGGWVLISILILLLVFCLVVIFVLSDKIETLNGRLKEIKSSELQLYVDEDKVTEQCDVPLTAREQQLLSRYKKLNEKERRLIDDTLSMLNDKLKDE